MDKSVKSKSKKLSIRRVIMIFLTVCFGGFLVLSYLASYISPDKIWIIAFFGITYPFLLLINLLFLFYWLLCRRFFFLLPLIIILIGWSHLRSLAGFRRSVNYLPNNHNIKVVSYNVRNFDLYNCNKDWSYNFEKRNKIFEFIKNESANIICFQEFFNDFSNKFSTLDTLLKFQKAVYYHAEYTASVNDINKFGIATFSSYPIISSGKIVFASLHNICIYSDIIIDKDTVRVYNVHFESIKLGKEDYNLAKDISHMNKPDGSNIELKEKSERLLKRLKNAFIKRAPEARLVADNIKNCKYPVILCGDFNDTPSSYVYHIISSLLKDSFIESGSGFGQTYIGFLPIFRIDYIFHSKEFKSLDLQTKHIELSDHYPVINVLTRKE